MAEMEAFSGISHSLRKPLAKFAFRETTGVEKA
jgi:hypothetical protein